jgi:CheY-like chemotaxis protein
MRRLWWSGPRRRCSASRWSTPASASQKRSRRFYRAGQETGAIQGTGIGLTITKRLAELMNGEVGFTSEQGRGSVFWVELPIAPEARAPVSPPRSLKGGPLFERVGDKRYLVVYVEDNPANIAFMEALVDDLSVLDLVTAHTAEIGLAIIHDRRPDVVIMDVNLPGMSGVEALHRLKSSPETRHIPVIGLSAAAMKEDLHRVKGHGFYRYLTKPVRVEELVSALEAVLDLR